jgi:hypothetical protein
LGYDEVRGGWRRLHNEELHDVYFSPDIRVIYSRRMRLAGYVARMGDRRGAYSVFLETPKKRRSLGKGKHRLEDNTKVALKEVRRGVDWFELAQDRDRWRAFVNVETNLQVP